MLLQIGALAAMWAAAGDYSAGQRRCFRDDVGDLSFRAHIAKFGNTKTVYDRLYGDGGLFLDLI